MCMFSELGPFPLLETVQSGVNRGRGNDSRHVLYCVTDNNKSDLDSKLD